MWLAARALADAGVRLAGDLQLHSSSARRRPRSRSAPSPASTPASAPTAPSSPSPPTRRARSRLAWPPAGFCWLKATVTGKATYAANRPLAIRPGGQGDAIGVNALEKGVKIVRALQDLERQWGLTKSHSYFFARVLHHHAGHLPRRSRRTVPRLPPDRAELHWILWYPPDEDDEAVMAEVEEYLLAACQLDSAARQPAGARVGLALPGHVHALGAPLAPDDGASLRS